MTCVVPTGYIRHSAPNATGNVCAMLFGQSVRLAGAVVEPYRPGPCAMP
jgi:hypothetical protein